MSDTYGIGDVLLSPVYGILDTASNLPFVDETGLADWLDRSPLFRGSQNFRDLNPGGALVADIAAAFVPYVGWAGALNKVGAVGRGLLPAINRAGVGAAKLFPTSTPLAFAAGETVRYAPVAAAVTGFDLLGDQYDSAWEALAGFGLGTALGGGFQALGHAAAPAIYRNAPKLVGEAWRTVFEPGPELSALYGFSHNQRIAATQAAANPFVQSALAPENEPQIAARALWDILESQKQGLNQDIDPGIVRSQYDTKIRDILHGEANDTDQTLVFGPEADKERNLRLAAQQNLRNGPNQSGVKVRVPLLGTGESIENPDFLAGAMQLPQGWLHEVKWPGIQYIEATGTEGPAETFRRQMNLVPFLRDPLHQRVQRKLEGTGSGVQTWSAYREPDTGLWHLVTEIPGEHNMSARGKFERTKQMPKITQARAFLSFKTDRPGRFLPEAFVDTDNANFGSFTFSFDRVPRGKSKFLDQVMDLEKIYLSPQTIKEIYAAWLDTPKRREAFTKSLLAGPSFGEQILKTIETYAAPTIQQLKDSPRGRAILGLYQAAMEGGEARARQTLHGKAGIPEGMGPVRALFSKADVEDLEALVPQLRRALQEDPNTLELIRRFDKQGDIPLDSIRGLPAGKWIELAIKANLIDLRDINGGIDGLRGIRATDARLIKERQNHFGLSHSWDGSTFIPIYRQGATKPEAVVAGGSEAHARQKANAWIDAATKDDLAKGRAAANWRAGKSYLTGETDRPPNWLRSSALNPRLIEPRSGMRGYEHEFAPYNHVDDFIAELEDNYIRRWRYGASTIADALTVGKKTELKSNQPKSFNIVDARIAQLKGQPGPIEERTNQIVDSFAARYVGTNSLSKAADAFNGLMFHLLHGVGQIATPALNLTSVLQTQLPMVVEFLTSNPGQLKGIGYWLPRFDETGKAAPGFNWVADPIGLLWGGIRTASNPDPEDMEVFQALWNKKVMGSSLANEYVGQDRGIATRASEGIRSGEDFAYWASRASSLLMSKSEQVSRTISAGMILNAMKQWERSSGKKFTIDQKIRNAEIAVERSNYSYFKQDRPMMYTTPFGAVFGNQKTWMTNYAFMMAHYLGLAQRGNFAPLLFSLGTTTALGGVFAVPLIGEGIDAYTEFFEDKDGREYIFEKMGEGGNAISFGLPSLFGISLSGNVAAPASNLAHDSEFLFSIVALERAKLLGRAIGRAWDDQVTLGINPWQDEVFQRQIMQSMAPRSLYRTWEAVTSDDLFSAATGYPIVRDLGTGERILHAMGFRSTETAILYEAYGNLIKDKEAMRRQVSLFGEAYAQASLNNDRRTMTELLQRASVMGLDINSVMMSAQVRMRNAGMDAFGRNFNSEQLERYQATLRVGDR